MRTAYVAVAALAVACSSGTSSPAARPTPSPVSSPSAPSTVAVTEPAVWLCRPGAAHNPCASDLTTTAVNADGTRRREPPPTPIATGLDCFYVYPTVSGEPRANADLVVHAEERYVATAQAARFSTVCRVWAPMYRQRTVRDLSNLADDAPASAANQVALDSLRSAWRNYLAHFNNGRRVVFIGHSQGAAMLIRLLRSDIDPNSGLRAKMALALLIGGNVTVAHDSRVAGSFRHLPLCTRRGDSGCVIAYSSFPSQPPFGAFFGRAGFGVSFLAGEDTTTADRDVACVNPAAPGRAALLHSYFPAGPFGTIDVPTPWATLPGRYRAECRHGGGATWLQVTPTGGVADRRPRLSQTLGKAWGYHLYDVNLALGDLVQDVAAVRG